MATTSTSAVGGIGQDQFLQLLTAQLRNQDPTAPVSSQEFVSQLASLSTVQGLQSLNANFAQMLKLQELTQGSNLVGKTIEYTPAGGGTTATGTVDSVAVQDGSFVLKVGDASVGLDQISSVKA